MKENKARGVWRKDARFEAVDADRKVYQYRDRPLFNEKSGKWECDYIEHCFYSGLYSDEAPFDASQTLIERYTDERPKEKIGRFPWKEGARFETLDHRGHVWQFENKPTQSNGLWWATGGGDSWYLGDYVLPPDYTKTLIERYPSESETAPFVFGPEHVGKRVRHVDGSKGVVLAVEPLRSLNNQLVIGPDHGNRSVGQLNNIEKAFYSLEGKVFASDKDAVIFLDESETDAPDLQARVEALERLTSRMDSAAEIIERHNDAIWDYRMRIEALERGGKKWAAEFANLCATITQVKSQQRTDAALVLEFVNRISDVSNEVINQGASIEALQGAVDTLLPGFYAIDETPAKPDPTANPVAKSATESVISGEEMHKAFCKVCDDVFGSKPDPTAQKVEALKLLFSWHGGCKFMTVDEDGEVNQWSLAPKINGDCWYREDYDNEYVGRITPDPELSKILIRRHEQ